MKKVYACLAGEWVCLNDDPDSKISEYGKSPYLWWEEGAPIYSPCNKDKELEHSFYGLDYVHVYYKPDAGKVLLSWRSNVWPEVIPLIRELFNGHSSIPAPRL